MSSIPDAIRRQVRMTAGRKNVMINLLPYCMTTFIVIFDIVVAAAIIGLVVFQFCCPGAEQRGRRRTAKVVAVRSSKAVSLLHLPD